MSLTMSSATRAIIDVYSDQGDQPLGSIAYNAASDAASSTAGSLARQLADAGSSFGSVTVTPDMTQFSSSPQGQTAIIAVRGGT